MTQHSCCRPSKTKREQHEDGKDQGSFKHPGHESSFVTPWPQKAAEVQLIEKNVGLE
jgi:hypothetical protein